VSAFFYQDLQFLAKYHSGAGQHLPAANFKNFYFAKLSQKERASSWRASQKCGTKGMKNLAKKPFRCCIMDRGTCPADLFKRAKIISNENLKLLANSTFEHFCSTSSLYTTKTYK
jgi:hypothetical protein